ncbi:ATP synthase F1 subunit gamma [Phototrophicus methaneseepsis]|uniref:ATP synthase gamma chain n=2 Tax=Phototrophicus methaneseepsis TaxID=2710758 RepID=A0A7S8E707_9CHLR|nr:ATP synthase F1 subunit gamma [Phototrophicus methaneseepsis]QPC81473.1 ATP synthase F1 subunit gamma [Phototrophicus methaneseepsis]
MPPLREVRNRIRSVKNISQITRALEAVSASRVRRAQARALASRYYAEKAWEILVNVQAGAGGSAPHPLLTEREEVNRVMVIVITSDRGLAGSFNSNVIRVAERFSNRLGKPIDFVTVGRKGRDTLVRQRANIVAEFSDMPAEPTINDITPISRLAVDAFMKGEVDEVLIAYTDFVNMLTQRPVVLGWLPLTPHTIAEQVAGEYVKDVPHVTESATNYDYEPNASAVLEEIVPRFTELQLYQALLESQASEHAARMAAMRNATDNASQLVGDLTLEYNKARQAAITSEILDIVGGANALQQSIEATAKAMMDTLDTPHPTAPRAPAPALTAASDAERGSNGNGKSAQPAAAPKNVKQDDLKVVEGIGPKMEKALKAAGIDTWAKLAEATEADIHAAIEAAGMSFAPSLGTWSQQASYAAKGDWDGLQTYKNELTAGRAD